jgi:hypothetical protein
VILATHSVSFKTSKLMFGIEGQLPDPCGMWQANVNWNAQAMLCESSPTIEVDAHGNANRQFGVMKFQGLICFLRAREA